jgi:hypothetical protein
MGCWIISALLLVSTAASPATPQESGVPLDDARCQEAV